MSSETDRLIDAMTLWVCDACLQARENDEWPEMQDDDTPWPWSRITGFGWGHRFTPGPEVSHWVTRNEITDEIVEGFEEFSTATCGGCGQDLSGSRWRYAEWPTTR